MAGKAQWLGITLLASVVGLLSGTLSAYQLLKVPLQHLSLTTPVFVLDRARLIQAIPPNATPDQMAQTVEDWKRVATKLSTAGYLVIDSTAVIAAPADVYIRPEGR
ncbi:MAG: hypothetical protein WC856_05735 [Methylococcaceae bacterium]|jgi:hypothetical protein